nr:SDR family NAD(P)-dependent oxidoreductase [Variovorax sp. OV329]
MAEAYAAHGASVAVCGRNAERLTAAAARLRTHGTEVCTWQADVRDPQQLAVALEGTRAQLGAIGILVCGAAGNFLARAEDLSFNGFRTVVDIDLMGSFHAAKLSFEQLRQTRGSIVFVTAAMASAAHAVNCTWALPRPVWTT